MCIVSVLKYPKVYQAFNQSCLNSNILPGITDNPSKKGENAKTFLEDKSLVFTDTELNRSNSSICARNS